MLHRPFHEGHVDREVAQRLDDAFGVLHLQFETAVRFRFKEGRQLVRQQVAADGGAGADAQVAGELLLEQRLHLLGAFQGGLGMGIEATAMLVQDQALAVAIEQARTELMFQVLQRHARCRLGEAELLAGAGDAAQVGDGDEGGELAEGDAALHISFPDMTNKNRSLRSGYMAGQACATTSEVSPC
ncbi:hypothetical protein D3C72_1575810 [compost metagenome]